MASSRQLAAIMFTDIVGYTALMGRDEQKAMALLKFNRDIQKPLIEEYNGTWLKEMGDGTLISFTSASEAVYCALKIQEQMADNLDLNLRIGIHVGEIILEDGDVFGDGVNIASRLENVAPTGGIWVSESVSSNIQNKQGIETRFIREEQLKNVKDPVRIYEVKLLGTEKAESLVTVSDEPERPASSPLRKVVFIALAVVAVFSLIYFFYPFQENYVVVNEPRTIAVIAFDDQSPDGDQGWFGEVMADEILNILAQVNGLMVSGKTSSFLLQDKGFTTKEIGETLGVNTVLEGSVLKVGNKYRVTAQLIDVETEAHLWSEKYDSDSVHLISIIDEVAQNIAGALMSELSIDDVKNIGMVYKPNPKAFEYFIKAEYAHRRNFEESKALYQLAISTDPGYATAYAGFANLYDTRGNILKTMETDHPKRDSILNIAYQIDPDSPYVLYMKGFASIYDDSAFFFLAKAYEIDPRSAGSGLLINKLHRLGLFDLSTSLAKRYVVTDPVNEGLKRYLFNNLWISGKIIELKDQIRHKLELGEDNLATNDLLFRYSVFVDHDTIEAKRILKKMDQSSYNEARRLAIEGKTEEALDVNLGYYTQDLELQLMLDMKSEALTIINQNIKRLDNPESQLFEYLSLKGNPIFTNIRNEPQFQVWLKEAKVVYDERMRKYGHLFDD